MSFGRINMDEGQESGGDLNRYLSDVPRLILLVLMLLAAIIGGYINSALDRPEKLVGASLKKSLDHSFRASLEGTTTLQDSVLSIHRTRQQYSPGKGITSSSRSANGNGVTASPGVYFDAFNSLEALRHTTHITEQYKEDMYGHATRHFTGAFTLPTDNKTFVHAYEYWIDMTSLRAVRLVITTVERNAGVDDKGESISKITHTNIRYFDWR